MLGASAFVQLPSRKPSRVQLLCPCRGVTLHYMGGDLGSNNPAIKLFRSQNRAIRIRAAKVLMHRWRDVPLNIILEILDDLHNRGLGAGVERILLKREDPELVDAMVSRLRSPAPFVRETACKVLGRKGGRKITGVRLAALVDQSVMVRRAAGLALADISDPRPFLSCSNATWRPRMTTLTCVQHWNVRSTQWVPTTRSKQTNGQLHDMWRYRPQPCRAGHRGRAYAGTVCRRLSEGRPRAGAR